MRTAAAKQHHSFYQPRDPSGKWKAVQDDTHRGGNGLYEAAMSEQGGQQAPSENLLYEAAYGR